MADPYTIRIFVPDGDPEGVRIVDRMNRTGIAIAFPRSKWSEVKQRQEFSKTGVYIFYGYDEKTSDDRPTAYVGKAARDVRSRIDRHTKEKDFWETAIVFVSRGGELNAAHVDWLEYALVERAEKAGRCHLDNDNSPQESTLSEAEKADTKEFLKEILQVLPLLGIHAFDRPHAIAARSEGSPAAGPNPERDTIIIPAHEDGFRAVFLGANCWYAIRISGGMIGNIRYIAGYQTAPVGAITHFAEVSRIEPYGDDGKFKVIFTGAATPIGPIPYADAPKGSMQGPRYTSFDKLSKAKKLSDLLK